jgi:hypothetical protein
MIINVYWSSCKILIFCQILLKLESPRQIFKKYSNFMKIRPVGAELFCAGKRADGQTDRRRKRRADRPDEANSRFSKTCDGA